LLSININELVAVKAGFSSGYPGEGPRGLSTALQLLERHGAEIDEYSVAAEVIERVNASCLLSSDIENLEKQYPDRPAEWYDYILDDDNSLQPNHSKLRRKFPVTIPYSLIDERLVDLALQFSENPDSAIMSGYTRLEDIVRQRTGLREEHGAKLFSKAFQVDSSVLHWKHMDPAEAKGRGLLFSSTYMGFRNARAHKETKSTEYSGLREFLLLNELFLLESEANIRPVETESEHNV
jgi:hypothetical protein